MKIPIFKFKNCIFTFEFFNYPDYLMTKKKEIESYRLGKVQVIITETDDPNRYHVDCNDGNFHSDFTVRKYEYEHYKRHMNQKITLAYKKQYKENEE